MENNSSFFSNSGISFIIYKFSMSSLSGVSVLFYWFVSSLFCFIVLIYIFIYIVFLSLYLEILISDYEFYTYKYIRLKEEVYILLFYKLSHWFSDLYSLLWLYNQFIKSLSKSLSKYMMTFWLAFHWNYRLIWGTADISILNNTSMISNYLVINIFFVWIFKFFSEVCFFC